MRILWVVLLGMALIGMDGSDPVAGSSAFLEPVRFFRRIPGDTTSLETTWHRNMLVFLIILLSPPLSILACPLP